MRLLIIASIIASCSALYEDQVGKFDWRKQFVGCPHHAFFHKGDKSEQLVVATRENVIASLSKANGDLVWRRIQEDSSLSVLQIVQAGSKRLYTVSDAGKIVRSWNAMTGSLLWQRGVCTTEYNNAQINTPIDVSQGVYAYSCGNLYHISAAGEEIWKVHTGNFEKATIAITASDVRIVAIEQGKVTIKVIINGKVSNTHTVNIKGGSNDKCTFTGSNVVCFHSGEIYSVDVTGDDFNINTHNTELNIREVATLNKESVVVRSPDATIVLQLTPLKEILTILKQVYVSTLVGKRFIYVSSDGVSVINMANEKEIFSKPLHNVDSASVAKLFANSFNDFLELFVVYGDCRTDFLVLNLLSQSVSHEWVREEGLARIASVEMIDLPLSESQQLIEDEFDDKTRNMFSSFLHRMISQLIQLQRWFVHTIHKMVSLTESVTSKESFSNLMDSVKANSLSSTSPLERDFFNLRKMLIAVSLNGVIFGIDSDDGSLVWRTNLGAGFAPLKNNLDEQRIPLFIQRSTSNYHLNGQAAVVFKDSFSDHGVLFVFNPITGAVIERKVLDYAVKRVDILPFAGKDQIHSLVIIDTDEKVSFYPEISGDSDSLQPMFIITHSASQLVGKQLNYKARRLQTVWNANIHLAQDEKIIAVKGKPSTERVHSQGRVLIDRDVQYKYSNPNLVAVASLDNINYMLTIYLIDVVSGLIVHTSKLPRAAGPVHLVHCENWVAYSYWSEKSRRTEIGIIELFEGKTQSNQEKFDSLSPTARAPEVTTQSYVYAQGVDAMAVSETEQGLTTRSIILALPFGGLHEVSRKLLDANRPQELTQEMREEGYIPYMPELPIATEEMINYNQTVFKVRRIKTAPSGLESTSLVLAYGIDIFFTRLYPSGTFDILKDDFDHVLISLVLAGLFIGSFVSKRIARNNALKALWA